MVAEEEGTGRVSPPAPVETIVSEKASWASSPGVARSMRSNRRRNTKPEIAIRSLLHKQGLRYRVDFAPLPSHKRRRADIVFTRLKIAVFVDGCFWHGCPEHATYPKSNEDYWLPKLARNIERDRETDAILHEAGWKVIRVWEHVVPEKAARLIVEVVADRRSPETVSDRVQSLKPERTHPSGRLDLTNIECQKSTDSGTLISRCEG